MYAQQINFIYFILFEILLVYIYTASANKAALQLCPLKQITESVASSEAHTSAHRHYQRPSLRRSIETPVMTRNGRVKK